MQDLTPSFTSNALTADSRPFNKPMMILVSGKYLIPFIAHRLLNFERIALERWGVRQYAGEVGYQYVLGSFGARMFSQGILDYLRRADVFLLSQLRQESGGFVV